MKEFLSLPFLDNYGFYILLGVFAVLLVLESFFSLRKRRERRWIRWLTNGSLAGVGLPFARLLLLPATVWLAYLCRENNFGVLNWLEWNTAVEWGLGILFLDYFIYLWHRLNHIIPFLWRFHQVHHADIDMDISTAVRFHFGEMLLSIPFRLAVVALTGVSPLMILVYEVIFESATLFHHSNLKLPLWLERLLAKVIITPRIHGIHHSIVERETNSNYSTVFSFWDRLHRSNNFYVKQSDVIIGIPGVQDVRENRFWPLLKMPFVVLKKWVLPSGEVPEREEGYSKKELPG